MGYESLSTLVVLVIVVILLAVWLPRRTANGMERVNEHREDRYSPSMHLVDADSGTRFSDVHKPQTKGAIMQSARSHGVALSPERIAEVRRLRREAIRRRRIIVVCLLAITVVVLVISFPLGFSPLFALIPAVLLVVVLALGVRASKHAREWEVKVAAARAGSTKSSVHKGAAQTSHTVAQYRVNTAGQTAAEAGVDTSQKTMTRDGVTQDEYSYALLSHSQPGTGVKDSAAQTDVMEQREIRRALRDAERERAEAMARRRERRRDHDEHESAGVVAQSGQQNTSADSANALSESSMPGESTDTADPAKSVASADDATQLASDVSDTSTTTASEESAPVAHAETVLSVPPDLTSELSQVHPAPAFDAFEMATASQDLISFSLGAPRDGFDVQPQAPESLEIKSTKQVAKAVPVSSKEESTEGKADSQDGTKGASSASSGDNVQIESVESASNIGDVVDVKTGTDTEEDTTDRSDAELVSVNNAAAFHESEIEAQVDAPEASCDSLGTGLDAILARRGA